ncbi:hypothetical protein FRB94_001560, partial [Tulasnella sp. JGI-2019a]
MPDRIFLCFALLIPSVFTFPITSTHHRRMLSGGSSPEPEGDASGHSHHMLQNGSIVQVEDSEELQTDMFKNLLMSLEGDYAIDWPSFDKQIEGGTNCFEWLTPIQPETLPPYTGRTSSEGSAMPPVIETSVENAAAPRGHLYDSLSTKNGHSPTVVAKRPKNYLTRGQKKKIYQIFFQASKSDNPLSKTALARMCGLSNDVVCSAIAHRDMLPRQSQIYDSPHERHMTDTNTVSDFEGPTPNQRETFSPSTSWTISEGSAVPPVVETTVVENAVAPHRDLDDGVDTENERSPTVVTKRPRAKTTYFTRGQKRRICEIVSETSKAGDPVSHATLARLCNVSKTTISRAVAQREKWEGHDVEPVPCLDNDYRFSKQRAMTEAQRRLE